MAAVPLRRRLVEAEGILHDLTDRAATHELRRGEAELGEQRTHLRDESRVGGAQHPDGAGLDPPRRVDDELGEDLALRR